MSSRRNYRKLLKSSKLKKSKLKKFSDYNKIEDSFNKAGKYG